MLAMGKLAETVLEGLDVRGRRRTQDTYPVDLCRLLRVDGERRREEAASHHDEECAPMHY